MAWRVGAEALAAGAASDHVQVVARVHPTVALATLVQQLKGGSSSEWNAAHGQEAALKWQEGYWAESCSPRGVAPLLEYVLRQREHHAPSTQAPESWEDS